MTDDLRPPYRIAFDNARDPYTARNALGITELANNFITSVTAPLAVTGGNLTIDLSAYASAADVIPHCGRLTYVSATALSFAPFNGDRIKIGGTVYAIPSAGIAGLTNGGLSASTTYYVYAYNNAGTVTGEFSTTTHATSTTAGNIGVEIKSGDNTRTLIGVIATNASSQFQDTAAARGVISWFNRRNIAVVGGAGIATTSSTSLVELASSCRAYFLCWTEGGIFNVVGRITSTSGGVLCSASIGYDSTTTSIIDVNSLPGTSIPAANYWCNLGGGISIALSEGFHYITPLNSVNAASAQFGLSVNGLIRG